jgi:hypothetical protein
VEGFADLGQQALSMMIYHRFMRESGHFHLLKLTCCSQYRRYPGFRQTTLRAASNEINS